MFTPPTNCKPLRIKQLAQVQYGEDYLSVGGSFAAAQFDEADCLSSVSISKLFWAPARGAPTAVGVKLKLIAAGFKFTFITLVQRI